MRTSMIRLHVIAGFPFPGHPRETAVVVVMVVVGPLRKAKYDIGAEILLPTCIVHNSPLRARTEMSRYAFAIQISMPIFLARSQCCWSILMSFSKTRLKLLIFETE